MARRGSRRRGDIRAERGGGARKVDYTDLVNPFTSQTVFSDDEVAAMHNTAMRVLEELGIKILLPEARQLFAKAGAIVDQDTLMVRIGRDIVESALELAPRSLRQVSDNPRRTLELDMGRLYFKPGSGCPNVSDRERGRRPGDLASFEEAVKLSQSFDVMHLIAASPEPQDVPVALRHYATTKTQLALSDKPIFCYSRGQKQVEQTFEMVQLALDIDDKTFRASPWVNTVINSNSPRQLDIPMSQGIIDFARWGQLIIMTPFCLLGAMAPVTIAGALTLQHAEAMAGITLAQIAKPGAPVLNGGFSSNVDLKSGAPAFGTPEHIKTTLGAGQLARHLGIPWRSAIGAASNIADAQGAIETVMSGWGTVLAGATLVMHSAGWLEGGLTFGYEKFINDMEAIQIFAELCQPTEADEGAIGFDAIAEVDPGGHFFAAAHTMERYQSAFYDPFVADLSNFGSWEEAGARDSNARATQIWKQVLADYQRPPQRLAVDDRLANYIETNSKAGGAPVVE